MGGGSSKFDGGGGLKSIHGGSMGGGGGGFKPIQGGSMGRA